MAILDSLIIQLSLDNSSLTQGAKQAQRTLADLETKAASSVQHLSHIGTKSADAFGQFRREAMGAMALFTGGKSLSHLTQEVTQAHTAFNALSHHLSTTPPNLTTLYTTLQKLPQTPPTHDTTEVSLQNRTSPSSLAIGASTAPPHTTSPSTPPLPLSSAITQQLETWAELLRTSSLMARHALEDVEPTLHNAHKALTNTSAAPLPPAAHNTHEITHALTNISALLTARSALSLPKDLLLNSTSPSTNVHTPKAISHQQHPLSPPPITSQRFSLETPSVSTQNNHIRGEIFSTSTPSPPLHLHAPHPPREATPPPSPSTQPDTTQLLHHYHRISQLLRSATPTQDAPHTNIPTTAPLNSGTSLQLPSLNKHLRALSPSRPKTTHNTTTHSPTINITIHGTPQHHPEHIAHATQQGISAALSRHELNRIG